MPQPTIFLFLQVFPASLPLTNNQKLKPTTLSETIISFLSHPRYSLRHAPSGEEEGG